MSKSTRINRRTPRTPARLHAAPKPVAALPLRKTWPISLCVGLVVGSIVFSGDALAGGPTGGVVVGGSGTITQSGNSTVINQASSRLALNWQTFNVGANDSVLFNQPGRSAVALNRILDQNPSQIFGRITSNGQIFLINTHGIIFGATAQMNVGGLLASTLDLTPNDFLAGHYNLNAIAPAAGVVNHGLIQAASGGSVSLVGGNVLNDGLIFANYGKINLDGADHATLDFDGNGLINIQITGELKQRLDAKEAAVTNKGTLSAESGTVVLQASATKDLFTNLVNNSGVIDASGISTDGGVVRLVASGGNAESSGTIDVSGNRGGRIEALSNKDVMITGGTLNASGSLGGGVVRIGGGIRGGEGLAIADRTYVADGVAIKADAAASGNGGSIAVFSQNNSVVAGNLFARGGIHGGNGGFIETSSHGALTITGTPQAGARHAGGLGGQWLVDPNNITIVAGTGSTNINAANPFLSTDDGASLGVDLITGALTGGANVTVTTGSGGANAEAGDITLNADLDYNGKGTNTLTFDAANDIVINNNIFDSTPGGDALNLSLLAGNNINLANDISLGTGSATLTATAGSIMQTAGKLLSAGTLTATAATGIGAAGVGNEIHTQVGALVFTTNGTGDVFVTDADALTVSGTAGNGSVGITSTTGDLAVGTSGIVTAGGAVTLKAAAADAGVTIGTGATVDTTNGAATGANVSLVADNADIIGTIDAGTAGTVAIRQTTAGRKISLGSETPAQLSLTSAELDQITANTISIGDAGSGDVGILAAVAPAHATTLSLNTGGAISQAAGATLTVDTLNGSSSGATTLGEANHIGNLGSFTASSLSLSNAAPLTLFGDVTTSGAQTYNTAILLGSDITLTTTNSAVNFAGTVDNADTTARNLTVNAGSGAVTFGGAVGGDATNGALGALAVNSTGLTTFGNVAAASVLTNAGGSTRLGGNITTSGTQTYNDAVTLGSDAILTTTNSAVNFAGTVDNADTTARNLTVNAGTGAVTFGGAVGGDATNGALGALAVNSTGLTTFGNVAAASVLTNAGGSTRLGGNITTSGTQTYNDAVTLGSDAILTTTNSVVNFAGTVDNADTTARNLTVNAGTGAVTFGGAVGGDATNGALGALAVNSTGLTTFGNVAAASVLTNAGGSTRLGGNITTSGTQTYNDAVTLGSDAILTTTNSAVTFDSTVDNADTTGRNLTVNAGTGAVTFGGAVGGDATNGALAGLTTHSGSLSAKALTIGSGGLSVTTTTGDITQSDKFAVAGLSSFNAGNHAITLTNADNDFQGDVTATGAGVSLVDVNDLSVTALTDNAGGNVSLVAGGVLSVPTAGIATGAGDLTLKSNGGALSTSGALSGTNVSLTGRDGITLGGDVSALGTLTLTSTDAAIAQTGGSVTATGLSTVVAGAGDIMLTGAINGFADAMSLTGKNVSVTNNAATKLGASTVTGTLDVASNGALTQTGALAVTGAATFTQNSAITGATQDINLGTQDNSFQSGVTFAGTINNLALKNISAAPATLTLPASVAGDFTLNYTQAALTLPLLGVGGALDVTASGGIAVNGDVTTGGSQAYHDAVTLGSDAILTTTNSAVNFAGTVDNADTTARNLTVNAGSGAVTFGGAVGGDATNGALAGLTTHSGSLSAKALTIGSGGLSVTTTTGDITQSDKFAVAGLSSFNAGNHAITLTNADNDFQGDVTATGAGVSLVDVNDLSVTALTDNAGGNVSLVAGGVLSVPTAGIATGAGDLTLKSNGGALSTSGALSGTNVSLTGRDGITLGGDVSALGTLTLTSTDAAIAQTGGSITAVGASTVSAGSGAITLTQVNDFTGAVTLTGATTQITDANALTLGTLNTGALTAVSTDTLNLGKGTVAGHLSATSNGGAIIQSGALSVTGGSTSDINAGGGVITLMQANDFTGAVTLTGATTQITDANALTLGTLNTGALTAVSTDTLNLGKGTVAGHLSATSNGGAIIQSGALSVTGGSTSDINAGGGVITLMQANDFTGAVTLTGATTQITDANALTLGTLNTGALTAVSTDTLNLGKGTVAGHLSATSNGGAIIQSGALSLTGGSTSDINAGGGAITLMQANDFTGAVTLTGATTQITDANALTLGTLNTGALTAVSTDTLNLGSGTVTGALSATSNGGTISQSGAMTVAGSSTLNAGSGALALTQANNDFQGDVTATGAGVSLVDANDLSVTALTDNAGGNVSLVAGGVLSVPTAGIATGAGDLTLKSNGGALSTSGALSGTNVSLTGRDGITLGGDVSALGTLTLTSTDAAIAQLAGNITATGPSTVAAGTGAIMLDTAGNNFIGAVNLAGGTTQVTDQNALTFGTLATGALTATSSGALNLGSGNVGGNLVATSNNGAIGQAGLLKVTGTSLINAGTGAITLTQASNDFQGGVSATGTGVSITDANNLAIAALNDGANGTVNLIAGGVLTLPAGAINTGTANLVLTSSGGALTTPGSLSGHDVSLTGHGGVSLNNNVTATGTLSLISGATISQGAGIITAGTLTGSSVGSTLLGQANKIGTLGSFSAASFSLINAQALTANGPLTTTSGTGAINLKTTSGALAVNADLAGGTVALTSAGNLALTKNLKGTTVALASGGNISQGAGIITAGTLSGSAAGSTTLNQANKVDALGTFSAHGFSLTNSQALAVNGPVTGGANTALTTTAGGLAINAAVSGTTTTLKSAAAISEGASGSISATALSGQSAGATALNGNNHIGTLGKFSAASFGLTNAQALTVSGPIHGGSGVALTTTAGDLVLDGAISGSATTLKSTGTISEAAGGSIVASTLSGQSAGATRLDGTNHIGTLGRFSAADFGLTNAQALVIGGPVNGGASVTLTTTAGDLTINGQLSGDTTTLNSASAIIEGAGGSITANLLTGHAVGNTTLDGNNHIDTLGSFSADFSLTNAQTLTVTGPLDGGPAVALTTTAGDLLINGAINGTTTTLKSAGAIREGDGGSITASTLSGQSAGATALTGNNHIGTLGSFSAASFDLTNAQALTVGGPINGGASTTLTTTAGDLTLDGAVSGTSTALNSAGAINEGVGGSITAGTLSGHAMGGPTALGSASHPITNMVDTLGNFSSPAGFSMTNDKTLTLASIGGSAFTVDAGTSAFYLSVTHGDLFQLGTAPVYDGLGMWSSTGRMGTGSAPIYVVGTGAQTIAMVGLAPAYFYATDSSGSLLPLGGGLAINVPTASGAGSAQNGNHGDSYIDPGVITANYRSYGIVPSGVRLPADQQSGCDPDQPDQLDCEDVDSVGMVGTRGMMGARMGARP